jgi:hypothetical protein
MKAILLVVSIGVTLGCGSDTSSKTVTRDTLTERQRDSILANSKIPGARGVGSALRASDSVGAHVQRVDSVASDTTDH